MTMDMTKNIKKTENGVKMSWNEDAGFFWNSWLKSINNGITVFSFNYILCLLCVPFPIEFSLKGEVDDCINARMYSFYSVTRFYHFHELIQSTQQREKKILSFEILDLSALGLSSISYSVKILVYFVFFSGFISYYH